METYKNNRQEEELCNGLFFWVKSYTKNIFMKRELIIIDWFNLIFRVFYAVPPFHTRDGKPVNALFGYTKALMQIMKMEAEYVIMTFDSGGKTFRSEADATYKAQRDGMPDDLASQMDAIFEVTDLLWIPRVAVPWFEADDIIGTLAVKHRDDMERVLIVSSDKDLFQFIGRHVYVYDAMKDRLYDEEEAVKKFEVHPGQIVDYLALIWDTSDNIPGVKGIGPKTAVTLLEKYDTLDNIIANIDELSPKIQAMIGDGKTAKHSQFLATIKTDVPFDIDAMNFRRETSEIIYTPALIEFLKKYEFRSLLPGDIIHTAPIYTLDTTPVEARGEILEKLLEKIQKDTPYTLALKGYPMMTELAIALSEEEVYKIDLSDAHAHTLVQSIFDDPREMTTYNWKENARSMLWWLTYN
jgi:5'-3' exonuclease